MTRLLLAVLGLASLVAIAVLRRQPMPRAELTFREDDDGIQPPDPGLTWPWPDLPFPRWAPTTHDPRCTCPPIWHGIIPPTCPVHNPALPIEYTTWTDTGTTLRP